MSSSFTPMTSPTKPKSTGSGPPPVTTVGGRCAARAPCSALAPWRPTGFAPAATSAAHRSTLTLPATIIFMTSSVSSSVTRRPPTIFGVWPRRFCSSVACGPPPWTMTTRRARRAHLGDVRRDRRHVRALDDLAAELDDDRPARVVGAHGQPPGILERRALVDAEHEVHGLDRLAGAALDQVVGRGEARDDALAGLGAVGADLEADLGVVRPARPRPPRGGASRGRARTARARTVRVECTNLVGASSLSGTCAKHVAKMPRESGALTGHEADRDVLRARVGERLHDLGDVLVVERLVRAEVHGAHGMVRARARHDAAARRAGDARRPRRRRSSRPARASGRSASSIVVAKQPGDATYLACLMASRFSSGSP